MKLCGPALERGERAGAVVAAVRAARPDARLPGDLERIMPSFAGRFPVSEDTALWEVP